MSLAQRLPSKNKSFTSAQILTVTELRQQCLSLSQSNSSVRVTGTLVSHNVPGRFIRLNDPIPPKLKPANPYKKSNSNTNQDNSTISNHTNNAVVAKSSLNNNNNNNMTSTTLSSFSSPTSKPTRVHNPYFKPISSSKPKIGSNPENSGTTRKIVTIQKKRHISILERTRKNIRTSNKSISIPTKLRSPKQTPKTKSFPNSILVDISSIPSLSVKIGDLVMIIGEMRLITSTSPSYTDDNYGNANANDNWNDLGMDQVVTQTLKQAVLGSSNSSSSRLQNPSSNKAHTSTGSTFTMDLSSVSNNVSLPLQDRSSTNETSEKGGYLEARILQNAEGTNMYLFHQALQLRRKYYASIESNKEKEIDT